MLKRVLAVSLVGAALVACQDGSAPTSPAMPSQFDISTAKAGSIVPSRYIVVLKNTVSSAAREGDRMVTKRGGRLVFTYDHALRGFAADLSDADVAALRKDPNVDYIEADRVVRLDATQTPTPTWGLDRIDQVNLPYNQTYNSPNTGAGVVFYSIDTGIQYTNTDFGGRASPLFDAITPGGGAVDCNGHGTHTTGTTAGATYGVAKGATIRGVRVLDCGGSGTFGQVIAGIDSVTANHASHPGQRSVANMSLGGSHDPATDQAVTNSIAAGVVYAVSAGNSNLDACTQSPASTPNAITVAASDSIDRKASFSNTGPCVDIFAPGVHVKSDWLNNTTMILDGTSMSSPHVAGSAILYLAANPSATPSQVAAALTSNATPNKITGTLRAGTPNRLLYMGFIGGGGTNQPPHAVATASCNAQRLCTFTGSNSTDDVGIVSFQWKRPNGQVVSNAANFTKKFLTGGFTGTVTLTVTDGGGLTNSATATFTVP